MNSSSFSWRVVLWPLSSLIVFVLIVLGIKLSTFSLPALGQKKSPLDAETMLGILSGSLGLLLVFNTSAMSAILEELQWTLVNQSHGVRAITFLSISPSTSFLGAARLALFSTPCSSLSMAMLSSSTRSEKAKKKAKITQPYIGNTDRAFALIR